jgi:signal peptidase II
MKIAMMKKNYYNIFFLLSLSFVILDQATKLWVKGFNIFGMYHKGMFLGETKNLIGSFVQCIYVENAGMAFGIGFGPGKIFLSLFSVIASVALIYYLYKISKFSKFVQLGIALILAGALGNLIDRVFYGVFFHEAPLFWGRVVDFIQVDIPDINFWGINYTHWPVFNVADSCVTIGIIVLLLFNKKIPSLKDVMGVKPLNDNPENAED